MDDITAIITDAQTITVEIDGGIRGPAGTTNEAANVNIADTGSLYTASTVEGALQEVATNVNLKANKAQEAWITPTLLNGWVNFDLGINGACSYRKDQFGVVHIKGLVKGTIGQAIFTLPEGYRPIKTHYYAADSGGAHGRLIISHTTGNVTCNVGSGSYVSLYEIQFESA